MPWKEVTKMSLKIDFIKHALEGSLAFSDLCERYKISRKTGYKLLKRYEAEGKSGLKERSRKPHSNPNKTEKEIEEKIIALRQRKPSWGGRKIRQWLINHKEINVPAASTITDILHRYGYIKEEETKKHSSFKRFEHKRANDLWQIDFKGHFGMRENRCHPLTMLDDHSRFCVGLKACLDEKGKTVKPHFIEVFEEYGLPYRINFDNGSPWGTQGSKSYTELSIWLIRLGIRISFSRPHHPQTNGKDERFHRTLNEELLKYHYFWNKEEAQKYFDEWREEYNYERPHESLGMKSPISRYSLSKRKYQQEITEITYRESDEIRKVNKAGNISYRNRRFL